MHLENDDELLQTRRRQMAHSEMQDEVSHFHARELLVKYFLVEGR